MSDAFENTLSNLRKILSEVCCELSLDYSLESLCAGPFPPHLDVCGTLDAIVEHLLEAEWQDVNSVVYGRIIGTAKELVRELLLKLKAEQADGTEGQRVEPEEVWFEIDVSSELAHQQHAVADEFAEMPKHCFYRTGPRVFVELNHSSESNFFTDLSSEISRGGLFVATYDVLKTGTPLNVQVSLPGGSSFPVQGSVSWVRELEHCDEGSFPGMGIRFDHISADFKAAVSRFMTVRPPLFFEIA